MEETRVRQNDAPMPEVNWNNFEKLPGSAETNFETLCRALVHFNYAKNGSFRGTANQPGVEFHLKLEDACAVGAAGRWLGWQCRWYQMSKVSPLGKTRRDKILKAIRTTEKVLPELTDWILWTRFPLTVADQKWYYAISTKMKLALWTATNAEMLLGGDSEILRSTYFGELVLTPANLSKIHDISTAPIRHRWLTEVHQQVDAERTLRRMLGETLAWNQMAEVAARLSAAMKELIAGKESLSAAVKSLVEKFAQYITQVSEVLIRSQKLLETGDFDLLRQTFETRPREPDRELTAVPRFLRAARSPLNFDATNALADIRLSHGMLREMESFLNTRLVAVTADAGGGKTQLAAQLTAPERRRPAGIFIHGRKLQTGQGLNDLAQKVQGKSFTTMEALVAALDAAGQRARCRLPLVIDGLNEAEDPRDWKAPLAELDVVLRKYANVLVVCTLRTGSRRPEVDHWNPGPAVNPETRTLFADIALPEVIQRLEMDGFGVDTSEAIHQYFRHYRIAAGEADIPFDLLAHPLYLRIFCDVTNPKRERQVGIESMPRSLTALFESYLLEAAKRIAELSPKPILYAAQDVRKVFDEIGARLWEQRSRELDETELRKAIGDEPPRLWDNSLVRLLEQEGVILRVEGKALGQNSIIPAFDALGGYMVANALLSKRGRDGFMEWIKKAETLSALAGNHEELHPLSTDIFRSLAGLVPRRLEREQLWPLLEGRLRTHALIAACRLEAEFLDAATVSEIAKLVQQQDAPTSIFIRLRYVRSSVGHPLNADFLDSELRKMSNSDRDLRWTEWLRAGYQDNPNLSDLGAMWRDHLAERTPSQRLRAKWFMWFLTTTCHEFRDKATRALYWFGRGEPAALFALTIDSLSIGDPYVPERMVAASYGVAMAAHAESKSADFQTTVLPAFARQLYGQMFAEGAPHATTHVLMREYARRILQLAILYEKNLFSKEEAKRITPPFKDGGLRDWKQIATEGEEVRGRQSPFRMDFENYTLGRLVPKRRNYDYDNPDYRKIFSQVLWRIDQLGWSAERFATIDQQIESRGGIFRTDRGSRKINRYGEKYSWIAYHEMTGIQSDAGKIQREYGDGRPWGIDIDPSFPLPPTELRLITRDFLNDSSLSIRDWVERGSAPNVSPYLRQSTLNKQAGPWVALDGFFTQEDKRCGRRLFCFIRSFLVASTQAVGLKAALAKQSMEGRWLPEKPAECYMFSGEFPWCATFQKNGNTRLRFVVKEKNVKVRRKRDVYFLDEKEMAHSTYSGTQLKWLDLTLGIDEAGIKKEDLKRVEVRKMIVEVEEIQQKVKDFNVLQPVCDFNWEGPNIDDRSVHATILAKEIAQHLKLVAVPESTDAAQKDGTRATCAVRHDGHTHSNSQAFTFMREDLLQSYLRKKGLSLIWVVWGERETSAHLALRRQENEERLLSGLFQEVIQYS